MRWKLFHMYASYALIFVLYALTIRASPSSTEIQPSRPANTTSADTSTANELDCFTPFVWPHQGVTNARDCKAALQQLVLTPGFSIVHRFTKNPRMIDAIRLPKAWIAGDCVIMLGCANNQDSSMFRFADVAVKALAIMENCIEDAAMPYGGIAKVGPVDTFYVSVGTPPPPPRVSLPVATTSSQPVNNSTSLDLETE